MILCALLAFGLLWWLIRGLLKLAIIAVLVIGVIALARAEHVHLGNPSHIEHRVIGEIGHLSRGAQHDARVLVSHRHRTVRS